MSGFEDFEPYLAAIEAEMKAILTTPQKRLSPFYGMMRYHLGWTDERLRPIEGRRGKRLRPLLCLLTCEATGGRIEWALPVAAAIELMHNFSLVHDDIEDGDEERRGRPTVWKVWGEAQAINVGDGLLALSHLALHRLLERGFDPAKVVAVIKALDEACVSLCQGQYLDMSFESRFKVTLEEYLEMVRLKTAALISCAARTGAILATEDKVLIEGYRRFGENLGMAFQIMDDILGIWGDPKVTGKPAASDIAHRKKTLPILYALEQRMGQRIKRIYRQEELGENDVRAVLHILDELKARDYAQEMAEGYHKRALAELEAMGIENEAQSKLKWLATFLIERTH